MVELLDYINLLLGIGSTIGIGYSLGYGDLVGAGIFGVAALIIFTAYLAPLHRKVNHLHREQIQTPTVSQLVKPNGEIELEVASQ